MHTEGLAAALSAFLGIWFGHVLVRVVEFRANDLRPPGLALGALGVGLLAGSLASQGFSLSAALGILGMTVLFDALELWRQEKRVRHGHAPANPANPRHARILAACPQATTRHLLERQPIGRPYSADELEQIRKGAL